MKFKALVCLFAVVSPPLFAAKFLSSSGQETYETDSIYEPKDSAELKEILRVTYKAMKEGDTAMFPLALGSGGYWHRNGHYQGLSFGAHAFGKAGQTYLSTRLLQKPKLEPADFNLDLKNGTALVRVNGGNTQGQVLEMAKAQLPEDIRKEYTFFMTGPSSEHITVAGALAAHTHYRSTFPYGGYFLDQVENFTLVAIQDGQATEIFCSRERNSDLFHSIPGSFGRGGVITDVTLKLQLVPKNYKPTTTAYKFENLETFLLGYAEAVKNIQNKELLNPFNRSFLGINGFMSDNQFNIVTFDFQPAETVKDAPYFDLFNEPGFLTNLGHFGSHSLHPLANWVTENYVLRADKQVYKNDLRPWLYFHNGFTNFQHNYDSVKTGLRIPKAFFSSLFGEWFAEQVFGRNMQTAHQAYVMKLSDFEKFMHTFTKLVQDPRFSAMRFKFRDFVPMPATRTLMSPAYSENPDDVFAIATLSWPVNSDEEKKAIDDLKKEISALDYVRIHPHKEFDSESDILRKSFAGPAAQLEQILAKHKIDDRIIWTKIHKALYGKE